MANDDVALFAHLMRRAGFGATRAELQELASKGYEAVVEDLLHPERSPDIDEHLLRRYYMYFHNEATPPAMNADWLYRMINTGRPLQEKTALFWHHVFATAYFKSEHPPSLMDQIDTFRRNGLSDMRTILMDLSRDPAMIYWLDNNENHKDEPNENYGRELLELFSMGVGNYTEQDIKMAARAFTGWTFKQPAPLYPNGHYSAEFDYNEDDHDDSVKTFLGESGRFNGEDIVDIIVKRPATARFIARHLYNFFVADEPQVPAWPHIPPQDPDAIAEMVEAYFESDGEIRAMLRVLFTSDWFKAARFKRVKSPAELVAGTVKLVGTHRTPQPDLINLGEATTAMGHQLNNPPTVEGWHTGKEWIDGGTLNERVNFAVGETADISKPGIQDIIAGVAKSGGAMGPGDLVDSCAELVGPLELSEESRSILLEHARAGGDLHFSTDDQRRESAERIGRMVQLLVASREYQFA